MYCHIEGCNHNRKRKGVSAKRSESWNLFHICSCCAIELFPNGFIDLKGEKFTFGHSNRCSELMKEELEKLIIKNRRELAKESNIQNSPIETKNSQIGRSNHG